MQRAQKRDHVLDVASKLFSRFGYHVVGVDQIIAEAGVAKTTLYRHFNSKNELIVSVLQRIGDQFRNKMRQEVETLAPKPEQMLLACFDFLRAWFQDKDFYGCPFISALGEYGERDNPIFQEVVVHKRLMLAFFAELARAAKLNDPEHVAEQINLLYDGAIIVAKTTGDPATADKAKAAAARIIKDYIAITGS